MKFFFRRTLAVPIVDGMEWNTLKHNQGQSFTRGLWVEKLILSVFFQRNLLTYRNGDFFIKKPMCQKENYRSIKKKLNHFGINFF
jgi:hypothetical protein